MVKRIMVFAIVAELAACGYGAGFRDCTITCSAASGCPSGLTCDSEGLCRTGATAASCSAVQGDAGMHTDGSTPPPPDALRDVVLSETTSSDATEAALSCLTCAGNVAGSGFTQPLSWYREFSLPDFAGSPLNVHGPFDITMVHVGCFVATSASISIAVYSYTGPLFDTTINVSASDFMELASAGPVTVGTCSADIAIPITASIGVGGAFVVEVDETDVYGDNNGMCGYTKEFRLGANSSGDTRRSYFKASCEGGTFATEPTQVNSTSAAVLISVEGTTD